MSLSTKICVAVLFIVPIIYGINIEEPCRKDAYPPKKGSALPTVILNLDLPPTERWKAIVEPKAEELQALIEIIKDMVPSKVINYIDIALGSIIKWLPAPYGDEIRGVADAANMLLGEAVLYNVFYEIFTACTSIVGQDKNGKLFHGRNLDFGLFMGWDNKQNTWAVTEKLRPLMVNVDYQSGGKTVFKGVHFIGYVGILTAMKPSVFTLTMNERFALNGGYVGLIEWVLGLTKGRWMGFLTRDVMLNATSYSEAKQMLSDTPLLAPAYFILGGNKSGEASLITRSRAKAIDVLELNVTKGDWFLLETNYDHWKKPLFIDDRRTPGIRCMNNMTQEGISFKGLYNVLSTRPTLNKLTTYTALMQVNDNSLETYLQNCPDPCWPW